MSASARAVFVAALALALVAVACAGGVEARPYGKRLPRAASSPRGGTRGTRLRAHAVPPNMTLPANLIPVPLYLQQTDYSCGPSSALSLLRYWSYAKYADVTEQQLYGPMGTTPQNGTDPGPIAAYFRDYAGIPAVYVRGNASVTIARVKQAIDDAQPPMVDLQAWRDNDTVVWATDWNDGHYNVVVGYDSTNLYFMDPSTDGQYAYIPTDEFVTRWHDLEGVNNVKVWHMLIVVRGTDTPTPAPPPEGATASYED